MNRKYTECVGVGSRYSTVAGAVLLILSDGALSGPLFLPPVAYGAGLQPHFVSIADFNGDGRPDLAVLNSQSNDLSLLLGNGDGTFQPKIDYKLSPQAWTLPKSISVGDLNDDGAFDVVLTSQGRSVMFVMLGTVLGTFQPPVEYRTAALSAHGADLGDLNGDGKLDVAVTGWGADVVAVRFGRGDGSFGAEMVYPAGRAPYTVIIEDFNRDGHNDVATANHGSANLSVLLNNGSGGLTGPVNYPSIGAPGSVRAADVNRDGAPDLVATGDWWNRASVLLGNGDGTFRPNVLYMTGMRPLAVEIGDLNRDGKPDVVTANYNFNYPNLVNPGGDSLSVLLGVGDGTFLPRTDVKVGQGPFFHAIGDLNCDGGLDVVVPNRYDANVTVLLNAAGSQVSCGSRVPGL